MLLTIDIGNTNITLGVWDGQTWRAQWRLHTVQEKTADEYGTVVQALLHDSGLAGAIDQIVLASVVPPLTATFTDTGQRYLGRKPLQVGPHLDTGIRVRTDNPAEVGADRIANAVAAFHLFPGPSLIIDMGTATTFDVVAANGDLLGVVIAPGLRLAADALAGRAAQLSRVALEAPPHVIGRNTIHAVQSGLIFGYTSLVEGIVKRLLAEHPDEEQSISIVGTGGLIHLITPHTDVIAHTDPWLTLTGLRIIGERAGKRPSTQQGDKQQS